VSWCDMLDDEVDQLDDLDCSPSAWASSSPAAYGTPSKSPSAKRSERRRRTKKPNEVVSRSLESAFDEQKAPSGVAPLPVGSVTPTAHTAVVTLGDIGFDCSRGQGAASPAAEARFEHSTMAPEGYCVPAGSPAKGNFNGLMSTSPMAQSERPRPAPVCLPMGALSYGYGCASPAASPAGHSGDASMRVPGSTPTASGDASTRTPMAGSTMLAVSPKALGSCGGTDASARTPIGCLPWQSSPVVASQAAEAASPCRSRVRMNGALGTSPTAMNCWSPGHSAHDTLRVLLGPTILPAGAELAARLQAAAPQSYED